MEYSRTAVRRINVGWICASKYAQTRHSGMDCRNLVAMDGNANVATSYFLSIYWIHCNLNEHIPVLWIPAFHAGMTVWVFLGA
jgi:hypothetical protein